MSEKKTKIAALRAELETQAAERAERDAFVTRLLENEGKLALDLKSARLRVSDLEAEIGRLHGEHDRNCVPPALLEQVRAELEATKAAVLERDDKLFQLHGELAASSFEKSRLADELAPSRLLRRNVAGELRAIARHVDDARVAGLLDDLADRLHPPPAPATQGEILRAAATVDVIVKTAKKVGEHVLELGGMPVASPSSTTPATSPATKSGPAWCTHCQTIHAEGAHTRPFPVVPWKR